MYKITLLSIHSFIYSFQVLCILCGICVYWYGMLHAIPVHTDTMLVASGPLPFYIKPLNY